MKNGSKLICLVFVFAIIGWVYPIDNDGAIWVVNNTNLAPFVSGHGGNGERIGDNTTYWTNNSPIQILLFSHANASGQNGEIHLYINGTKVSDTSGRPLGIAEENNKTIVATIPQYANYSVEMVNFHHYEWREYPILTGEVTTNITTSTGTSTGCEGNCSFDVLSMNAIKKNDTTDAYGNYINLSSPFMNMGVTEPITSEIDLNDGFHARLKWRNSSSGFVSSLTADSQGIEIVAGNGVSSVYNMFDNKLNFSFVDSGTFTYSFNKTDFDMGGKNITKVTTIYSNISGDGGNVSVLNNSTTDSKKFIFFSENNTDRTYIQFSGVQLWKLKGASAEAGYITYSTPGGFPGIVIYNSTFGNRIDIFMDGSNGLRLRSSSTGSGGTNGMNILPNGTIKIDTLAGAGNAYTCTDNLGQLYRGSPGC